MKRIEQKVKDLVEVRNYASLQDFTSDPAKTLTGYHFTDVTADLMAKWLNKIARITEGAGAAFALAGFRGVGKSHFLATLGAILGNPDLRGRISDQQVASSIQSLQRRQFTVGKIRRGTRATIFEEFRAAIADVLEADEAELSDSLNELMTLATEKAGDNQLVLLIDTVMGRSERVSRDDGLILSEIAEAAKIMGVFVGIALDDDIAGADGANSAIAKTFLIDYLDQEHLYKIVDTHLFPKHPRMQQVLREIYENYRDFVPGFRWGEQRFTALYPLHPAIMEIAPFVRLYLQEFALLSFASEAGTRILGRPANSLIGPDEVFDKIEENLRAVQDLKDAFDAFDLINREIVAKTPVMKRLQAKLILKGLLLFSLNDEGSTASEIGASMLIFDAADPEASLRDVEAMLATFATAVPSMIRVQPDAAGRLRYAFKLDGNDTLKTALSDVGASVPRETVNSILKRLMNDRFSDCNFPDDDGSEKGNISDCSLEWRGGLRKGLLFWNDSPSSASLNLEIGTGRTDWNAIVELDTALLKENPPASNVPIVRWRPSEFLDEEMDTIRRFWILQNDASIRSTFKDHIASAMQTHTVAIDKIFQRIFMTDGVLAIEGFEYNFTDEARSANSLSKVFTLMLESLFEGRFPMHPYFSKIIRMKEVSTLASDFFSGARPNGDEVQAIAATYGVPLGIVSFNDGRYVPCTSETLNELPLVTVINDVIDQTREGLTTLDAIIRKMNEAPNGLVPEATYLLLTAMVGSRMLEFVTSGGDRINHRSLDLKIIWDDIGAVTRPEDSGYTNERLIFWLSKLTGKEGKFSLSKVENRLDIVAVLKEWLDQWGEQAVSKKFDALDDDNLNTRIWRAASLSIRAFDIAAASIEAAAANSLPLEDCLGRIADAFSDSNEEFERHTIFLATVEDFLAGAELRNIVTSYLALCERTGDRTIDDLRIELLELCDSGFHHPGAENNRELNNRWLRFRKFYSAFFVEMHDSIVSASDIREKLDDLQKTDAWWEFESLSAIPGIDPRYALEVRHKIAQMRGLDCDLNTDELLKTAPLCGCTFSLNCLEEIENSPTSLSQTITRVLSAYRNTIKGRKADLAAFDPAKESDFSKADIAGLVELADSQKDLRRLTDREIRILRSVFDESVGNQKAIGKTSVTANRVEYDATAAEIEALLEALP